MCFKYIFNIYHKNVQCVSKNCPKYIKKMFNVYLKLFIVYKNFNNFL